MSDQELSYIVLITIFFKSNNLFHFLRNTFKTNQIFYKKSLISFLCENLYIFLTPSSKKHFIERSNISCLFCRHTFFYKRNFPSFSHFCEINTSVHLYPSPIKNQLNQKIQLVFCYTNYSYKLQ